MDIGKKTDNYVENIHAILFYYTDTIKIDNTISNS